MKWLGAPLALLLLSGHAHAQERAAIRLKVGADLQISPEWTGCKAALTTDEVNTAIQSRKCLDPAGAVIQVESVNVVLQPQMVSAKATLAPTYLLGDVLPEDAMGNFVWQMLMKSGTPACSVTRTESKAETAPSCQLRTDAAGRVRFYLSAQVAEEEISLTWPGGRKLQVPITSCSYQIGEPSIVSGASSQVITVRPRDARYECATALRDVRSLKVGNVEASARFLDDGIGPRSYADATIEVTNFPDLAVAGSLQRIQILSTSGEIGVFDSWISERVETTSGDVRYAPAGVPAKLSPFFRSAAGPADSKPLGNKSLPVAVVDPTNTGLLFNVVGLKTPSSAIAGGTLQQHVSPATPNMGRDCVFTETPVERRYWSLESPHDIQFCIPIGDGTCTKTTTASSIDRIAFSTGVPSAVPLVASLRLLAVFEGPAQCSGGTSQTGVQLREVQRHDVTIAHSARFESVAVPLGAYLQIECDGDNVTTGQTIAIDDDDLAKGQCKVTNIPMDPSSKTKEGDANAAGLIGAQRLRLHVSRSGATTTTVQFSVASVAKFDFTLPAPGNDNDGRGTYEVTVEPVGKERDELVVYRDILTDGVDASAQRVSEATFRARLRPRGSFGFKEGIRAYATAAVNVTGIRFPAAYATLPDSSSPTAYQIVAPQLGILVVVEPWDYVQAENPCPLGLSFAGGVNFLSFTGSSPALATVLGPLFQLPLLRDDTGQLGTSLALGLLWENDLQGRNAFLTTLGLNIGSAFSPSTKK